ncbi:hypothetical protein [Pedobacter alluvionis]|uniref:Lipoprotein n=1 Tax=Pedobacter alluvionis TaxID=475253 RepID=A0A497YDN8_9SPHI|nr:hypothetical protein [Pedobacter alluvionis]RLJ79629.1 hypothetical protein BCL90_0336 [Pedobacter alluvionis]TFB30960.1 hypothetical protein E3V97_10050 [Pedobacter alluvionis]
MIKKNILLALLILSLISCQSKKAAHLNTVLKHADRAVFNMMVGKNGLNEKKLKCVIDGDFKCALQVVNEEERAFNQIINKINAAETNDIKYGNALKSAAISYYEAVKQLEVFDRHEIVVQQQSQKANTEQLRDSVIAKQGQLLKHKLEMRTVINKKEKQFAEIQKQFNSVNNLD